MPSRFRRVHPEDAPAGGDSHEGIAPAAGTLAAADEGPQDADSRHIVRRWGNRRRTQTHDITTQEGPLPPPRSANNTRTNVPLALLSLASGNRAGAGGLMRFGVSGRPSLNDALAGPRRGSKDRLGSSKRPPPPGQLPGSPRPCIDADELGAQLEQAEPQESMVIAYQQWVETHITMHGMCHTFVDDNRGKERCFCGRPRTSHPTQRPPALGPPPSGPWSVATHCTSMPTTSYGLVAMEPAPPLEHLDSAIEDALDRAKPFVRCSSTTDATKLKDLLVTRWNLSPPRILISVTGGALSFDLPPKLEYMLKRGLAKAASSKSAWIIDGGTNSGVMKYVGEAVATLDASISPPVIGIVPWAIVNGKDSLSRALEDGSDLRGRLAFYGNPDLHPVPSRSLDANHSHFILVDDGRDDCFTGEIETRTRIEAAVANLLSLGEFGTESPVATVCIVIQGGPGTLQTCQAAVSKGTPCIVVNGSGKAANVLAYAFHLQHRSNVLSNEYTAQGLTRLIVEEFDMPEDAEGVERIATQAKACVRQEELVTIYDVDFFGENDTSLDVCILDTVLRYESHLKESNSHRWLNVEDIPVGPNRISELRRRRQTDRIRMLELGLMMGRLDVARQITSQHRFLNDVRRPTTDNEPIITAQINMLKFALNHNLVEFVKLFCNTLKPEDAAEFLRIHDSPNVANTNVTFMDARKPSARGPRGGDAAAVRTADVPLPFEDNDVDLPPHVTSSVIEQLAEDLHNSWYELKKAKARQLGGVEKLSLRSQRKYFPYSALAPSFRNQCQTNTVYLVKMLFSSGFAMSTYEKFAAAPAPKLGQEDLQVLLHAVAAQTHHSWCQEKMAEGWVPGSLTSPEHKTHAELVAFDALPECVREARLEAAQVLLRAFSRRVLVWRGDNFEDLFLQSATLLTTATAHLPLLFPTGRYFRANILQVMARLVPGFRMADGVATFNRMSPFYQLMVWAVLTNHVELAKYFWELEPGDAVYNAQLASTMAANMAVVYPELAPEIAGDFRDMSAVFSQLTVQLLDEFNQIDTEKVDQVLIRHTQNIGGQPIWSAAYHIRDKTVVSHLAVQRVAEVAWFDGIEHSFFKIVLAALLPVYLLVFTVDDNSPMNKAEAGLWARLVNFLGLRIAANRLEQHRGALEEMGWWARLGWRIRVFYNAPVTHFWFEFLSFVFLLGLVTYTAVRPTESVADGDWDQGQVAFFILCGWMLALIVEEIRQALAGGVHEWWASLWNRWDCIIYLTFVVVVVTRLETNLERLQVSRTLLGLTALMLWTRAARFFAISPLLGPKLVVMERMVTDVLVFVALLAVVLIGYGVAMQALLYMEGEWDMQTLVDVVFRPYFQIYGDPMLDSIREDSGCADGTTASFAGCGFRHMWLVLILLALYMLVANIVLVNLLIAMMSSTFELINEDARNVWCLQNIELVMEFRDRWLLPTPFNIINNVLLLLRWIVLVMGGLCSSAKRHHQHKQEKKRLAALRKAEKEAGLADRDLDGWSLHGSPSDIFMQANSQMGLSKNDMALLQREALALQDFVLRHSEGVIERNRRRDRGEGTRLLEEAQEERQQILQLLQSIAQAQQAQRGRDGVGRSRVILQPP